MLMIQQFMAMGQEERIEAGNQMDGQEKNQIMLEFVRMNTSIDESMARFISHYQNSKPRKQETKLVTCY
jgi:hypothetical protein